MYESDSEQELFKKVKEKFDENTYYLFDCSMFSVMDRK